MICVSLRAPLEMRVDTQPSIQAMKPTRDASTSTTTNQPEALDAASNKAMAINRYNQCMGRPSMTWGQFSPAS